MRLVRCLGGCLLLVNVVGMAVAGTMALLVVKGTMALLVGMLPLILLLLFNSILARLGGGGGGDLRKRMLLLDDERSWWLRGGGGGGKRLAVGDKAATPLRLGEPSRLLDLTTAGLTCCELDIALPLFSTDVPRALVLADLCNTEENRS